MHWLARVAVAVVVRRVVLLLLVAVLGVLAASLKAYAQADPYAACYGNATNGVCPEEGIANIQASKAVLVLWRARNPGTTSSPPQVCKLISTPGRVEYGTKSNCGSGAIAQDNVIRTWPLDKGCSARSNRYGGWQPKGYTACDNGCMMQVVTPIESDTLDIAGSGSKVLVRAQYGPSGASCPTDDAVPPPDQYCEMLPMGHKFCTDAKGRRCLISGTTGRKYCPETPDGVAINPDRTEGATTKNGTQPSDKPTPRQGEEWTKGPSVTQTNEKGGGCTSNCNNTTTSTIVNNSGTPNTTPGSGVPGDGSDNPGESGDGKDDKDEGDKGDVAGGANCANPPTVVGDVRQLEYMAALRDWTSLCEGLDSLGPEFADARANAEAALAELHGNYVGELLTSSVEGRWADEVNAILGGKGQHETGGEGENSFRRTEEIKFDELDDSGFLAGGSCPTLPAVTVAGTDIGFPMDNICEFLGRIGLLVEALAYLLAARILTGSK